MPIGFYWNRTLLPTTQLLSFLHLSKFSEALLDRRNCLSQMATDGYGLYDDGMSIA